MASSDGVEDRVDAVTSEPLNFAHEVLRSDSQSGCRPDSVTAAAPRAEQVPYISRPARRPSCRSAVPTPPAAPWISARWPGLDRHGIDAASGTP